MKPIFITGIDTDAGKTFITGLIGKYLIENGENATTFKLAQTGCNGISEDIETHRKIMGKPLNKDDLEKLTCPEVFKYPASPHLAASLEKRELNIEKIEKTIEIIKNKYDKLLIEGVGGIFVPLIGKFTLLDFIEKYKFPTIVVSTPKLGSINHTLMTLEILKSRKIPIKGLVYNICIDEKNEIKEDSIKVFKNFHPEIEIIEVPKFQINNPPSINFDKFNI